MLGAKEDFFTEEEASQLTTISHSTKQSYWLEVFEKVEMIRGLIEEKDKPLISSLNHIEVTIPENENFEYSLIFHFDKNEYIENETLEAHITVDKNDDLIEMDCDIIDWKDGRCLTHEIAAKSEAAAGGSKNKKKKKAKKEKTIRSFFHLFKTFTPEQIEEAEGAEDGVEAVYEPYLLGDVFSFIKNLVLKYHSCSFLGAEIEDYDIPPIDGFSGEGDEDEEDGDDDEDDDEDEKPKKKKTGGKKGGVNAEECKKQ